ncbi:hypothetical protein [Phormidesmis sp. 146-33]
MDELPLLELFTQLRKAGLPLGVDDYQSVLQALQAGYGVGDQIALARLCRTLWVRSPDERQLFEYYFEQLMSERETGAEAAQRSQQQKFFRIAVFGGILGVLISVGLVWWFTRPKLQSSITTLPSPTVQNAPIPSPSVAVPPIVTLPIRNPIEEWVVLVLVSSGGGLWLIRLLFLRKQNSPAVEASTPKLPIASQFLPEIQDEVQIAQTVRQMANQDQVVSDRWLHTTDFLPITKRQMKQSWRHLRRLIREGTPTELDVAATVQQIAECGVLLDPVLVPPRINRTELLLLIDQDGSMVAFRSLSERLVETAARGGRLGKMGVYYFHNCPIGSLYHDPLHQEAEPIEEVLAKLKRDHTVVLIFSDAGAARGGLNLERVRVTMDFLMQVKQQVRTVAWLNPMPRSRWMTTTAEEIARSIPMFEVTRQGLDGAIDALRGRHQAFAEPLGEEG